MRLAYDIETDGLYDDVTKIHCIVAIDVDTDKVFKFRPHEIQNGLKLLSQADELIGHNIIKYDDPVIRKLYPSYNPTAYHHDTLVYTRLIWSNIKDLDVKQIAKYRASKGASGYHLNSLVHTR
ncbi:ribonuclease H-like domain-containing protein [Nitrincola sp. A-D6]|uniref:ribonuclease H-like domain-containing protein n=1 Tax=Nitrincola sp. A-D6 TaxID=1545442 RepID=UPI000690D1B9